MSICNMDCFHCPYEDCVNDEITDEDRKTQDKYDVNCNKERIPEERSRTKKKYEAQYDYMRTEKRKIAQKRYMDSEKGKATQKRYANKKILSGKNAEYCRAYYYRKKQAAAN